MMVINKGRAQRKKKRAIEGRIDKNLPGSLPFILYLTFPSSCLFTITNTMEFSVHCLQSRTGRGRHNFEFANICLSLLLLLLSLTLLSISWVQSLSVSFRHFFVYLLFVYFHHQIYEEIISCHGVGFRSSVFRNSGWRIRIKGSQKPARENLTPPVNSIVWNRLNICIAIELIRFRMFFSFHFLGACRWMR